MRIFPVFEKLLGSKKKVPRRRNLESFSESGSVTRTIHNIQLVRWRDGGRFAKLKKHYVLNKSKIIILRLTHNNKLSECYQSWRKQINLKNIILLCYFCVLHSTGLLNYEMSTLLSLPPPPLFKNLSNLGFVRPRNPHCWLSNGKFMQNVKKICQEILPLTFWTHNTQIEFRTLKTNLFKEGH